MTRNAEDEAFAWQVGIWDKISDVYVDEIDKRFTPIIGGVLARAELQAGQHVMDLGSGTGAVTFAASPQVGASGRVTAVDISQDMLDKVREGAKARSLSNVQVEEGRGEAIPMPARQVIMAKTCRCARFIVFSQCPLAHLVDRETVRTR